jgi:hypothetical protein
VTWWAALGVRCKVWNRRGQRRPQQVMDYASLGKHFRTAPYRLIRQLGGTGTDRGYPWMTAVDRCLGHVGGTAGEDELGAGVAAMVSSHSGHARRSWCAH